MGKPIAEHQAILLAQVLRQRFAELTLGDLREILTSPLGRGLDNLKLAELSQTAALGDAGKRGAPEFKRLRAENANARIERVGAELRSHMSFINPKSAPDGWAGNGGPKAEVSDAEGVA